MIDSVTLATEDVASLPEGCGLKELFSSFSKEIAPEDYLKSPEELASAAPDFNAKHRSGRNRATPNVPKQASGMSLAALENLGVDPRALAEMRKASR